MLIEFACTSKQQNVLSRGRDGTWPTLIMQLPPVGAHLEVLWRSGWFAGRVTAHREAIGEPPAFRIEYDDQTGRWHELGAVATRAAAISFRLFLAFFPAVIFVLSVLPHTPLETEAVMDALLLLFPGDTVSLFEQTVADLLGKTQGALLSVGFVLTLYYASSSVHAVLSGFNESALLDQKGNPWLIRIWSMFLLVLLVVLLGVAVLLIGFSGDLLTWMSGRGWLPGESLKWFNLARWVGAVALIYSSVTLLYNVGHWDRLKWRTATPGAAMTTILMVLLIRLFLWRQLMMMLPGSRLLKLKGQQVLPRLVELTRSL